MRVVAGEYKGRRLVAPRGALTRPTADRVREAIFSILGDAVRGARVLDLFAGTGALGIEAISRGAATATFVERDRRSLTALESNLGALELEVGRWRAASSAPVTVVSGDAFRFLAEHAGASAPDDTADHAAAVECFDLVFLDPPYSTAAAVADRLGELLPAVLAPRATVITESDRRTPLTLDAGEIGFASGSEHRYGDTIVRVYRAS